MRNLPVKKFSYLAGITFIVGVFIYQTWSCGSLTSSSSNSFSQLSSESAVSESETHRQVFIQTCQEYAPKKTVKNQNLSQPKISEFCSCLFTEYLKEGQGYHTQLLKTAQLTPENAPPTYGRIGEAEHIVWVDFIEGVDQAKELEYVKNTASQYNVTLVILAQAIEYMRQSQSAQNMNYEIKTVRETLAISDDRPYPNELQKILNSRVPHDTLATYIQLTEKYCFQRHKN